VTALDMEAPLLCDGLDVLCTAKQGATMLTANCMSSNCMQTWTNK
jgi:hypothetical protein